MRILYLIESLEFGGAEKMLVGLANGFAADHAVTVCCIKRTGALTQELDPRIEVLCLDKPEGTSYGLMLRLWRLMRRGRYDVVHTHNWSVFAESGVAALLARVPVLIHTSHGRYASVATTAAAELKRRLRHRLERLVSHGYSHIVTVSDSIQQAVEEAVGIPVRRLITIHNGIDPGPPPDSRPSPLTTFVSVGRLVRVKRHDLMIRAFAAVSAEDPNARLLLVGDGPERQPIEQLVREHGIEGKVQMAGFRQDIAALLAASDIFLLTSTYEGISIALLEAMRAGLPAIGTRVGGIPETIAHGKTGLLVDEADAEGLRDAMAALARDPARRVGMSREARTELEQKFSAERMVSSYRDLYLGRTQLNPSPMRLDTP